MDCEELAAKLKSQKAALLRLQAAEMEHYNRFRSTPDQDDFANQIKGRGAYSDYLAAKAEYNAAARNYAAALGGRGVRG